MFRGWHLGLLVALATVLAFINFTQMGRVSFLQTKREIRETLGLPKIWMTNFNEDASQDVAVRCPTSNVLVVVTGGQSNAANAASDPLKTDPKENAYMFYNGRCYILRDPVLGATGGGGSLWTVLGPSLSRQLNRPVVFINGAVGGTQIGDWTDIRSQYGSRLRRQLALAKAIGYRPGLILWIQGETDSAAYTSKIDYQTQLRGLVDMLSAGELVSNQTRWVFFPSTYCGDRPGSGEEIQAATRAMVRSSQKFSLGPNLDQFRRDYRWDGCHLNSLGKKAVAVQFLRSVSGVRL